MHLHYLLIAHKNPEQVKRLTERLLFAHSSIYIHIDKNANQAAFKALIPESDQIRYVKDDERIESKWCDIGTVNATLALLKLVDFKNKPGYCMLMSGQDYPLKSNKAIYSYFTKHQGKEFITLFSLPNPIWLYNGLLRLAFYKVDLSPKKGDLVVIPSIYNKEFYSLKNLFKTLICVFRGRADILGKIIRKRVYPNYLKPFGGDTWWTLSTQTLSKILAFMEAHPDYHRYHIDTFCPDETMFHSIIARFREESDIEVLPTPTYAHWDNPETYNLNWYSRYQLPGALKASDFFTLKQLPEHLLFARKFDQTSDSGILDLIDSELLKETDY